MKKILLVLPLFLFNCDANRLDLVPEDTTIQPALVSNKIIIPNDPPAGVTVMDIAIGNLVNPSNGGCTYEAFNESGQYFYDSTSSFGPVPQSFFGYVIRGYGNPRTDTTYSGLRLHAENRGVNVIANGQQQWTNSPISNAISIEYNFKANVTYQVVLTTWMYDTIYRSKNNTILIDDDSFDIPQSEGYPTLGIELKSSPAIGGLDPCANRPHVATGFLSYSNYYKTQEVALTNKSGQLQDYNFYFSTLENRNAIIIYYLPKLLPGRPPSQVLQSNFYMFIRNIKIIEKPYNATYNVPPNPPLGNHDCGGFRDC